MTMQQERRSDPFFLGKSVVTVQSRAVAAPERFITCGRIHPTFVRDGERANMTSLTDIRALGTQSIAVRRLLPGLF